MPSSFFVKMGCNTYGMKISLKKTLLYWNIHETFITQKNEFMFKINLFISATFVHVSVVQPLLFKLYLIKL